jgi:hypothetical protein
VPSLRGSAATDASELTRPHAGQTGEAVQLGLVDSAFPGRQGRRRGGEHGSIGGRHLLQNDRSDGYGSDRPVAALIAVRVFVWGGSTLLLDNW